MAVGETGLLPSWQAGEAGLDLMAKGKGQVTRFQSGAVEGKEVSGLPLSFRRFNGRRWRGSEGMLDSGGLSDSESWPVSIHRLSHAWFLRSCPERVMAAGARQEGALAPPSHPLRHPLSLQRSCLTTARPPQDGPFQQPRNPYLLVQLHWDPSFSRSSPPHV